MKYFFCKLNPPRPDFAQTMTAEEAGLMEQHAVYWRGLMERGLVAVLGLVGDPKGAYGIAVLTLDDDGDPHALTADDPVIKAQAGLWYDIFPMPRAVARP
jgi:hypothetical protein